MPDNPLFREWWPFFLTFFIVLAACLSGIGVWFLLKRKYQEKESDLHRNAEKEKEKLNDEHNRERQSQNDDHGKERQSWREEKKQQEDKHNREKQSQNDDHEKERQSWREENGKREDDWRKKEQSWQEENERQKKENQIKEQEIRQLKVDNKERRKIEQHLESARTKTQQARDLLLGKDDNKNNEEAKKLFGEAQNELFSFKTTSDTRVQNKLSEGFSQIFIDMFTLLYRDNHHKQAEEIYKQVEDKGSDPFVIQEIVVALVVRWIKLPERMIAEYYQLLSRKNNEALLRELIKKDLYEREQIETLKKSDEDRAISKFIYDLANCSHNLNQFWNNKQDFNNFIEVLDNAPKLIAGENTLALKKFYVGLEGIGKTTLNEKVTIDPQLQLPDVLNPFYEEICKLFSERNKDQFSKYSENSADINIPEQKYIKGIIKDWSCAKPEPTALICDVFPFSMNLDKREEEGVNKKNERYVHLNVLLKNAGTEWPAHHVKLCVSYQQLSGSGWIAFGNGNPKGEKKGEELITIDTLNRMEQQEKEIHITYSGSYKLEIYATYCVHYDNYNKLEKSKTSSGKENEEFILEEEVEKLQLNGNPYIPNLPVISRWYWDQIGWEQIKQDGGFPDSLPLTRNHQVILEEVLEICKTRADSIKTEEDKKQSGIQVILGSKGMGKTSILYQLQALLKNTITQNEMRFIPVLINLQDWVAKLNGLNDKSLAQLTINGFIYELAEHTKINCQLILNDYPADNQEKIDNLLAEYENLENKLTEKADVKKWTLELEAFAKFLKNTSKQLRFHTVFLIDNGHYWEQNQGSDEPFAPLKELFGDMKKLLHSSGNTSTIVISFPQKSDNYKKYKKEVPDTMEHRITLLTRERVEKIISFSECQWSTSAKEYIWRFTGGWPVLLQFVLYQLMKKLENNEGVSKDNILINLTQVKETVRDILNSDDHKKTLAEYLAEYDEETLEFLGKEIKPRVDGRSMVISGITHTNQDGFRFDNNHGKETESEEAESKIKILRSLYSGPSGDGPRQVIEVDEENRWCKLHIGLFYYPQVYQLQTNKTQRS